MNAEIYHPNPSGEGTGAARLPVLFLRTIVYVDGFNFYNRTVNHTPYKWLDIKSLCEKLLKPQNKIDRPCRKLMSIANFKAANYIKINGVWKNKR